MRIKNKILLLISSIIIIIMVLILSFNQFAFEKYYLKVKKELLVEIATQIKSPNFYIDFTTLEEDNNLKIYLTKSKFLTEENSTLTKEEYSNVINKNEIIYKVSERGEGKKNLILVTKYDRDLLLILVSPFNSIEEPVKIINDIYIKIIFVALILGGILSLFLSKILSAPIIEMKNIAKKVAELDFTENFKSFSNDEVGELGKNLNIMERNLKRTIDILKRDIEIEKENENQRKQFISNLSHELKTPISIISNYSEGLKEGIASDKETQDFYLETIIDEAQNMSQLVQSLLLLSRSERNYLTFQIEDFDIKEVVDREIGKLKLIFTDKNISVKHIKPSFKGDKDQFFTIVKNLLENACKHSEGDNIEVRTEGNYFEIKNISNLPEKEMKNIWIPFYRMDKARNRENGTGLGLAIVKELLEKQNYTYGCYKEEEKIVFWFKGEE